MSEDCKLFLAAIAGAVLIFVSIVIADAVVTSSSMRNGYEQVEEDGQILWKKVVDTREPPG